MCVVKAGVEVIELIIKLCTLAKQPDFLMFFENRQQFIEEVIATCKYDLFIFLLK
jgi:hypothetical protein